MREASGPHAKSLPPDSAASLGSGGRVTERYSFLSELASGGMGVVYRVFDRVAGEERALKRIKPSVAHRPFFAEAFKREYHVLAGLDHPRIIRVFDYGVDEQGPYYTMELLEGSDLNGVAPLPYREACAYLRDIATSLSLLHARRLIHRDLSPGNVRRTPDGRCKLFDFGALTAFGHTREIVGTPPAIPPEAVQTGNLDHRSDLYQLGALAYWLLTGTHAYPAKSIDELGEVWQELPPLPSELVSTIPPELDLLVLSLLSRDPLARPGSAAEVISRLEIIGQLAPENQRDAELLAQSFLLNPRFIGRVELLDELTERANLARKGQGSAVLVEASAGMGRTRLLEELGVRAQIAGATVLRVDASVARHSSGTLRALCVRMLDARPRLARSEARPYRHALAALGSEVEARLGPEVPSRPPQVGAPEGAEGAALEGWFTQISRKEPLVILVDNLEYADDASLGVLAALTRLSSEFPLFIVFAERRERRGPERFGLTALRNQCARFSLSGLTSSETLELVRSLFGDTQNVERYAEWLHRLTAGNPLHCIEISRTLVKQEEIRYSGGMWHLPVELPHAELPAALEDALYSRLEHLGEAARGLVECLSLQRERPSLELCRLLVSDEAARGGAASDDRFVLGLLDELARNDVLHGGEDGYHFSHAALREAVLSGLDDDRRRRCHARLGEAFARLGGPDDAALMLEAGYHLIEGGDELRGADMIARVASNSVTMRRLIANLHRAGYALEAALKVYRRYRLSVYQRAPLLSALAHAAYYEDRVWADRYGDEALDTLEHISGLRLARFFARFVGRHIGFYAALLVAFVRFLLVPRRERSYSFRELMVQMFGAVTTLTGTAVLALDVERAARVAALLEPFSVLPEFTTPVGIYQFCRSLEQIGRDNQAQAYEKFDELVHRFSSPRYYRALPDDARLLYITGAHFARGAFAVFRAEGSAALESADVLDSSGMKLYAMIASALRFQYFLNRGEIEKANAHREQVELHAAHVGSAWQVEQWEAPALLPIYLALGDLVGLSRVRDRLAISAKQNPSLQLYRKLADSAMLVAARASLDREFVDFEQELERRAPRSFIGWAAASGHLAGAYNQHGRYAEAKAVCERTLKHYSPRDHAYVNLYMHAELQLAYAEAGLGNHAQALALIGELLARYRDVSHPLLQGRLHEARAQIAWAAGLVELYEASYLEAERWFRATGTPALIAKCERLAELSSGPTSREIAARDVSTPRPARIRSRSFPAAASEGQRPDEPEPPTQAVPRKPAHRGKSG